MFKLIKDKDNLKIYENDKGYEVAQRIYSDNTYTLIISIKRGEQYKYLAHIYPETDKEENIIDFVISTTSYGALTSKEIQNIIDGYNLALSTVKELKELFNISEV